MKPVIRYFVTHPTIANLLMLVMLMGGVIGLSRMNILVGTYLLNTSAVERDVGPFFRLFGDRALKQWGDRWQRGGALSKSLPRPGDLLRQPGSCGLPSTKPYSSLILASVRPRSHTARPCPARLRLRP